MARRMVLGPGRKVIVANGAQLNLPTELLANLLGFGQGVRSGGNDLLEAQLAPCCLVDHMCPGCLSIE
jgi:hypothetical protein